MGAVVRIVLLAAGALVCLLLGGLLWFLSLGGDVDCGAREPGWGFALAGGLLGLGTGVVVGARLSLRALRRVAFTGLALVVPAAYAWFVIGFDYGAEGRCWSSNGAAYDDAWFFAYVLACGVAALAGAVREARAGGE